MCQILPIIEHEAKMTWLQHQQQAAAAVSEQSLKLPLWHLFKKLLTIFGLKFDIFINSYKQFQQLNMLYTKKKLSSCPMVLIISFSWTGFEKNTLFFEYLEYNSAAGKVKFYCLTASRLPACCKQSVKSNFKFFEILKKIRQNEEG